MATLTQTDRRGSDPTSPRGSGSSTPDRGARPGRMAAILAHPMADFYFVLSSVAILVGIGLMMGLSASSVYAQANGNSPYYFAVRQLLFLVIGAPAAWLLSRAPERALKVFGWAALIGSMFLLLLVVATPLGIDIKGNRAWLSLGGFSLQPSEFAKVAIVLWGAAVLSTKEKLLDQPRHLLVPLVLGAGALCGLVLLGGDLGTGMVMVAIFFAMLWLVGASWRVLGLLVVAGGGVVALLVAFNANRLHRIMMFLSPPEAGDVTVSQQPLSAIYALASGGWFGVGVGASRQKWVGLYDGAQNDYIFAVLGEELGLFGTLAVIVLLSVLAFAGFRIAMRSNRLFYRLLAGGLTSWLLLQSMLNIAVAMRLVPVIGVPLPFLSIGGSALLAALCAAGLLLAAARNEPDALAYLDARRQAKAQGQSPRVTSVVEQ